MVGLRAKQSAGVLAWAGLVTAGDCCCLMLIDVTRKQERSTCCWPWDWRVSALYPCFLLALPPCHLFHLTLLTPPSGLWALVTLSPRFQIVRLV